MSVCLHKRNLGSIIRKDWGQSELFEWERCGLTPSIAKNDRSGGGQTECV